MISLPSGYVLKKGSGGADIQSYEFLADFGESARREKERERELEQEQEQELAGQNKAREASSAAQRRLETAREEAEEILKEAHEQAEVITREAREEGYQIGYKEGYQTGREEGSKSAYQDIEEKMEGELDGCMAQMRQIIDSVSEEKQKVLERYLDDLKRICLAVSEKIIQTSLRSSGEVIKRMIVAATDKIKKVQWAKIYISKRDAEMIVKGDAQLLREMSHLTDNLKVVAMENEDPGTCIIELPDEIVDASVNTQMENIKDILNNARL